MYPHKGAPRDIHTFTPQYLKLSEAEQNWLNQQKIEDQLQIRRMSHEDVPEVFDLEQASFQHSSWTIDAFIMNWNKITLHIISCSNMTNALSVT